MEHEQVISWLWKGGILTALDSFQSVDLLLMFNNDDTLGP